MLNKKISEKVIKVRRCMLGRKYCYDNDADVLRAIFTQKISEFLSGTRTHNLQIAGETL